MNISNIKLNGINYNLTDKETQNLISQVQANTYTKEEIDNTIANISQGSVGDISNLNAGSADKLNTKLLTNENLNDIKDDFSVYYAINFTGSNKPSVISYAFGLICMRTFSNNFKQIITDATSDNSCVRYFRNATSAWSAWKKLLMEDNIQLVSAIPANPDSNTLYCIPEEG